ncbi:MAG TPA: tetratricopeptide repeat protein [Candidatus Baltobacteraceae bacterium]|nr:tetratricopeptide repeat protein [Candidatus Baltobacteraceae bacterium]
MKRIVLTLLVALGCAVASFAVTTPSAQASLFGGKAKATPSPSPSPSALPTASPEPPSVAIPRLQAKLKANPNDQQAAAELAAQYLSINRPDLTLQITQKLLQAGDKTAQVYYYDGFAAETIGNIPEAQYDLEQAANLDPTNMGVLSQLADLYLKMKKDSDAERIAKRAVTFNKTQPMAFMTLGSVYAAEGYFDKARTQFEAAYALDAKDVAPLYQIATTYAQQNNIPLALQTIDRALAIDPKSVQSLSYKASLYADQHDDAKTSAAFDDAVVAANTDDQKVGIMVQKARYFAGEKKDAESEAILKQATTQFPHVAAGFVAYGNYFAAEKQWDKASAQWQAALAIDPDNAAALLALGTSAAQNGHVTQAVSYLKHYTQVSPDAQGFAMLGEVYSQMHDYSGARQACGKSFEIQKNPDTLSCVAGADYELKNYKEAVQIFDALDRFAKGYLDQNAQMLFIAAKSYSALNQCSKSQDAYKRLMAVPGLKQNAKQYSVVKKAATDACRPSGKHSG